MFDPLIQYENAGDFLELRKQFRNQALNSLRMREGLPVPTLGKDGRTVYLGEDGNLHSWATGNLKQPSIQVDREGKSATSIPTPEISEAWNKGTSEFVILDVAADGKCLSKEVEDLNRDIENLAKVKVDFGLASEAYQDLKIVNINDEQEVDSAIQEYIKNHDA